MISLSLAHTHIQKDIIFFSHIKFFTIIFKVNTDHNLGTFAKKMSPTSLTMPCSMLSSSSKEMVLPSNCVATLHKRVHKKKKHVPNSDGRFNMHNRTEKNHTSKAKLVTNLSEHPMPTR